jgi:hypothetical protein
MKMSTEAINPENMGFELHDNAVVEWMKTHTLSDIKDLVFELYAMGEDVSELVAVVNELEEMEMEFEGELMYQTDFSLETELALA